MSVGHVARGLEEAGIPTVTVMVRAFRHVAEAMKLSRTVVTRNPMGRTMGAQGDKERQREVLETALSLLQTASGPVAIVEMEQPFRPGGRGVPEDVGHPP